jgi:uncharacterized protein YggE
MQNKLFASLVLASSLTTACTERVIAVPNSQLEVDKPGSMAVTGTATLEVAPDCADLTMTISSDSLKPADATSSVQAKEKALVDALAQLGVKDADVKLSYLTLEQVYDYQTHLVVPPPQYRAAITVTATTHDFGKIAPLMEAGAEAGATSMSSAFRRSDIAELKKKVREMAIAAAREKAQQTAHALGIELGRITSVAEAPTGQIWGNAYFPQAANAMDRAGGGGVTLGGALQPLTLDVSISFELAKTT